jgi:hypothetical protein
MFSNLYFYINLIAVVFLPHHLAAARLADRAGKRVFLIVGKHSSKARDSLLLSMLGHTILLSSV